MSCAGRTFPDVGRKMLQDASRCRKQKVDAHRQRARRRTRAPRQRPRAAVHVRGADQKAFDPKYWSAPGRYRIVRRRSSCEDPNGYTQMEINFSMFWGISIMLYEQTLISDQSRFDDWFASCRPAVTNPDGAARSRADRESDRDVPAGAREPEPVARSGGARLHRAGGARVRSVQQRWRRDPQPRQSGVQRLPSRDQPGRRADGVPDVLRGGVPGGPERSCPSSGRASTTPASR